jgi:hypothetical protein
LAVRRRWPATGEVRPRLTADAREDRMVRKRRGWALLIVFLLITLALIGLTWM